MIQSQHPSNNDVLRAPPGVPIEECRPLPITRLRFVEGGCGVLSYWKPTAEELARLNAGKAVALVVIGPTHPPLYLAVDGDPSLP